MSNLECPSCGGSIVVEQGDAFKFVHTATFREVPMMEGGVEIVDEETRADWCPQCLREWEARVS